MSSFPPIIELPFNRENPVSAEDSDEDKFPESFPRYFIQNYSKTGDKVFDPFIGHGTTAIVAEELGRIPYGIEADDLRYEFCENMAENWRNLRCCDALDMCDQGFPKMDFCVTSPPFMAINHTWNPLYEGDPAFGSYHDYLRKMEAIFKELRVLMKKNALVVVHADNVEGRIFTPLVRDFSVSISEHFKPVGEIIIQWQNAPADYPLTHALIFKNSK